MQNPLTAQPLHIRASVIILILVSLTLILNSVFEFLPLTGRQQYYATLIGYIGMLSSQAFTAWVMWPHWMEERKKTEGPGN